MVSKALLVAILLYLAVPAAADDVALWDNGGPDWRIKIPAPTQPEDPPDGQPAEPIFHEVADDFECKAEWKVTRISVSGLFGPLESGRHDPDQVPKSDWLQVKIHKPGDDGKPGEVFWSKTFEGEAARACQTFSGEPLGWRGGTFSDEDTASGDALGLPLDVEVSDTDGLVTLPPGKWFVSWRVMQSRFHDPHLEGGFTFCCLSSAHPHLALGDDQSFFSMGAPYWSWRKAGNDVLRWGQGGNVGRKGHKYNIAFKIYGEPAG